MQTLTRRAFPLVLLLVILVVFMPRSAKFSKDFKKGSPWKHETLVSQFDFPILKTDDQIQRERMENNSVLVPYFKFDPTVSADVVAAVSSLDMDKGLKLSVKAAIENVYGRGVRPDNDLLPDADMDYSTEYLYVQKGKRADKFPVREIYDVASAREALLFNVAKQSGKAYADSVFKAVGIYGLVVPNLVFDMPATRLVHAESDDFVSPTQGYVRAGQLIVSENEIVTSEIARILDSYKLEYDTNVGSRHSSFLLWLGNILIAIAILTFLVLSIQFTNPALFDDRGKYHYLLSIVALAAVITLVAVRVNERILYMIPFTLFAVLLQEFFRNREILVIYVISLLPLLVFAGNGMQLFVMNLMAGVVAIQLGRYFGKGWRQFIAALIVFGVLSVTYLAFYSMDYISDSPLRVEILLFVGSLLTVAGYPAVFLFEKLFNLVSSSRLAELCDTTSPLLRDLEHKAPGTFQHSLQVMNMADAVSRAIGADTQLVRAGALYHDIGKTNNPMCFVENESLLPHDPSAGYHSVISPLQSAYEIIKHVSDGVEMAERAGLPKILVDFIRTHHGTTDVSYFLDKHLRAGGDASQASKFRYPGPRPATREQIVLMLCDSVEAASRTLKNYTQESFDKMVESLVAAKMSAGQFESADITIRELGMVKDALKSYLARMYHERIAYPTKNKN